jgi:chaperonin GroES
MAVKTKSKQLTRVRPLGERVLVQRLEEDLEKVGSLYVPDTAKEKPLRATVIAVGPGRLKDDGKREPMSVKKGDVVLIGKYAGSDLKIGGEECVILREEEILGIEE